jgi:anti-sigma regulatory factor (Ser/Thr protein kinase)
VAGGRPPHWAPDGPAGVAGGSADGFAHHHAAALVGSEDELLAAVLPFLDAGLTAGDQVVLSGPPDRTQLLCRELGERAAGVHADGRLSLLDTRAPDAVAALQGWVDRATGTGSGRVRLAAEPQFGASPRHWREAQRYESAVNALLPTAPIDALCVYDRRTLPPGALDSARATHPRLAVNGSYRSNPSFQDPADYLRRLPLPREPLEEEAPVFAVDRAPTLAQLRHQLAAVLSSVVPDREQCEDMHLAVSEIAANAFRHGAPPVSARVWAAPHRVVCTIRDRGTRYDDPLAGFRPAHGADLSRGGMGLWLARRLWDHVDLLRDDAGLTVRLSSALY